MIEKLKSAIKASMIARETGKLKVLRMLMSETQKIALEARRKDIKEDDLVSAVIKGIKQRQDSIEQFTKGGRQDLVMIEEAELEIYKEFRLAQMSDDDLLIEIDTVLKDTGVTEKKQMGRVMGTLTKKLVKGTYDGKKLSQLIISKLN
tara:strand:+ start:9094 stop:9537 length:444 start_codon:yes stop_codon:yes gene_type:complete